MSIEIRPVTPSDVEPCAHVVYEAFRDIAECHGFKGDIPSPEFAVGFMRSFVTNPAVYGLVAESDGQVVGCNFLSEFDPVRGVGPMTVHPKWQGHGIGRQLMQAVIERDRDAYSVRLLQDGYNFTSLSLYASLGFDVKEHIVMLAGNFNGEVPQGYEVRPLQEGDLEACDALHQKVHGVSRLNELKGTPPMFPSFVALQEGRVVAYVSAPHFWIVNHGVAESEDAMQAVLAGAGNSSEQPLQFLLPSRQASLFRWGMQHGLRVGKTMTLMSMGQYQEPQGYYLPSVGY